MDTSNSSASPQPAASGRWRLARRLLIAVAVLATLTAVFYTVENWRGKRAWEQCRRALEAKGEVLDWTAYIPAPVPDDQNFFKAEKMQEWFGKSPWQGAPSSPRVNTTNPPSPFSPASRKEDSAVLAVVTIAAPGAAPVSQPTDAVLRLEDPSARDQAAGLFREALGPCAIGTRGCVLIARPLDQLQPLHLVLQTDTTPTAKELAAFFPTNPVTSLALAYSDASHVKVFPAGSNVFTVWLKEPVYGAADFLAWTEPLTPNFDLVRKALERPYARLDGDYQQPYAIPLPNFVRIRQAVQLLAQRAQCHLLLGQPEAAWRELALAGDLCQILGAKPPGKPITLVGAMITVAIAGLETMIVEDGLRLHAWREPQLEAIQRRLKQTDLLAPVVAAFREERVATSHAFEIMSRGDLVKLFSHDNAPATPEDRVFRLALACMPHGWLYQNIVKGFELEPGWLDCVDVTNQLVRANRVSDTARRVSLECDRRSPYTFVVARGLPNFTKAVQVLARHQTLVNQAELACALERYRLAQGQYPETLDALTPKFMETLPHDLIGGQPLKYQRLGARGYRLYSVGWNEKDDGGTPGTSRENGDWLWVLP